VIINNGEGAQTIDLAVEAGKNVLVVVGEQGADGKFDGTVSYEAAKTGDASPIFAVVAVMLVAGAALVTTASKKKFF
jgi:LPXTG-motif cell wall-anchored protein